MATERSVTRRDALRLGAATATVIGGLNLVATPSAATVEGERGKTGPQANDGEALSFTAEIEGCPDASKNIREVQIDELRIDARDLTTAPDLSYRMYVPGVTHIGEATLISGFTQAGSTELRAWLDAWAAGKQDVRKITLTVTIKDQQQQPGRGYRLLDCFPTQWSGVNFDTSSSVQTETLRVKVGRIEFKT